MDTKTLCLGALRLGDETGYDIKKRFEEKFGYFLRVASSGIYRALGELESEAKVEADRVVQDDRPNKKVYRITEKGQRALVEAIIASPGYHRVQSEFLFILIFADMLPAGKVDEVLDRHLGELQFFIPETERWLEGEGADAPEGARFVALYALDMMRAQTASIARHRAMLRRGNGDERPFDSRASGPAAPADSLGASAKSDVSEESE